MNNSTLKSTIAKTVKTNGKGEITGSNLQSVLNAMVDVLGAGYMYLGDATPLTAVETPDNKVFYLAIEAGTYTYFGNIVVYILLDLMQCFYVDMVHPLISHLNQ